MIRLNKGAQMHKTINVESLKVSCSKCSLSELCFPRGMDNSDMDALDQVIDRNRPIQKGAHLYGAGDKCKAIYAVRSGSIKTTVQNQNGESQIVGFHLPGELIGFDGFATDVHTCSAEILETTSVCELPLGNLETICETVPGLQRQMRRIMGLEVHNDHNLLLLLGKMNSDEKLATFLLDLSGRMKQRNWKESEFNLGMTRQDIANYLGLAVETVSRLFAQFQENGIISVDKRHVTITDMDALKGLIGDCGGNDIKEQAVK